VPDMLTGASFLTVVDLVPLVSIDLIVINPADQILLGRRRNRPAQGCWFVPGGRIHKLEKIAQAMIRISQSEIGISVSPDSARLLGVYDHIYDDNYQGVAGVSTHYVVLAYEYNLSNGDQVTPDDQHERFVWWDKEELLVSPDVHGNTKAYFSN